MADNGQRDMLKIRGDMLKDAYQKALKEGNVDAVLKEGMSYAVAMANLSESANASIDNILWNAMNLQDSPLVHRLESEAGLNAENWLEGFLAQLTKDFGEEKVNEAVEKLKK